MEKVVIVGGGVAGLSCLNALIDHNVSPLLLEGANIGAPKMCGEFLAPEAVNLLKQWDIDSLHPIFQANFFVNHKKLDLAFPQPAGAIARSEVEILLAQRARKNRGRIREYARIKKIVPPTQTTPYLVYLESGEEIQAETVIFATGKYGENNGISKPLPYFGIKVHFRHVVKPQTLLMYSMKDAYFGIVPLSDETSNCTCLVKRELIEKIGSCKGFFYQLAETNPSLQSVFEQIDIADIDWYESRAPEFQFKKNPTWPRAFWIGDALAGLYPAIGLGFSHSISSAMMAADFYLQNNPKNYHKTAKKVIRSKLLLGKLMHQLMLNPNFSSATFQFLQLNPWLLNQCLRRLGYRD
ncbi:MAG: FAD-dependent oxidoreductase [Gammaproteobacteria bacterium]